MTSDIAELEAAGREIDKIPVAINNDIIRLFSEGLYRSPHKAIEELVSNSYDADARRVHILLPEQPGDAEDPRAPLWAIDDGHGMDEGGFHRLWRVAESDKNAIDPSPGRRAPIGQFGIGKLAAYVLAWRLTHVSRVNGKFLLTAMNFRDVTGRQNESADPVRVPLREIDETEAREFLAGIKSRDPLAWSLMFDGKKSSPSWTAAALSDFKDLYKRLSPGRLRWVLGTGLPLHSDFKMSLNGENVSSSKENLKEISIIDFCDDLPGIGKVSGTARIHEKQLTTGKSEHRGRSNGFFIRVRGRVINLEDELFGVEPLNHAAWSRFALEVDADGLRDHLLSSREGVRDSEHIHEFRNYLREKFNRCRFAFDKWDRKDDDRVDIVARLSDSPSFHVTEPLLHRVRSAMETGSESFYIDIPHGMEEEGRSEWLEKYGSEVTKKPFDKIELVNRGRNAPALRYDPATRSLSVNSDHPFVDKLTGSGKRENSAKLFASSEVLLEGQLQDRGMDFAVIADFLRDRDRVLRMMVGDDPPTSKEVPYLLDHANRDPADLERAVGMVFGMLGFDYQRRGGNAPGPDGILQAHLGLQVHLGLHEKILADYKLVYDAKQTDRPSVPADKVDISSLDEFRRRNNAAFGFFVAIRYEAEMNDDGALNRRMNSDAGRHLTLLKIDHLKRLVRLHFRYGVTLTEIRSLFEKARTVPQVDRELQSLDGRLAAQGEISLRTLLEGLEVEKADPKATPNIIAVRARIPELRDFKPGRLVARLQAVETILGRRWIEVEESGEVHLHQTAERILEELERNIDGLTDDGI